MDDDSLHYRLSSYREKLVEHLFIAELLKTAWLHEHPPVEVLRSEVDMHGYDLVLARGPVVRHVQLKASTLTGQAGFQKVHVSLKDKPAGCVVWVRTEEHKEEGRIDLKYSFFGGGPNEPLPLRLDRVGDKLAHRVATHTKANAQGVKAERPNIREVPKSEFADVPGGMLELIERLFGPAPVGMG